VHKKSSTILLAPPQRSRLDSHLFPIHQQNQREFSGNDQEQNGLSPLIPNLEPVLPREESFT